jgi:ATP-dependent Clp protease ATP-binding subunit ClpA
MNNKRVYHIIIGPKSFFETKLPRFDENTEVSYFLELVKQSDELKQRGGSLDFKASTLILKNDNYHGITEQAHDRLGALIEELTDDEAEIYIHNPPTVLSYYLNNLKSMGVADVTYEKEIYLINHNSEKFIEYIKEIAKKIVGQNNAIKEISKSMWYLTSADRKNPYVIMLYGNSSLGKTELVREIADKFYENKYLEKHLSMFKNNTYSDYFFGEKPNRRTLGYELLERESNLIFLDELDKCPEYFFSAFYTLFDNIIFKDASYEVDISGLLIVLTSNFSNKDEIKKELGLPIYYRIDKFIYFNDFTTQTIYDITMQEIYNRLDEYKHKYSPQDIYAKVSPLIQSQGENARTIKYKIQDVIEKMLFNEIEDAFDN